MKGINKIFIVTLCVSFILTACSSKDDPKEEKEEVVEEKDVEGLIYDCVFGDDTVDLTEEEVLDFLEGEGLEETSFDKENDQLKVYTTIAEDEIEDGLLFTVNLFEEEDGYSGCYVTSSTTILDSMEEELIMFSYYGAYREYPNDFILLTTLSFIDEGTEVQISYSYNQETGDIEFEKGDEELDSEEFREMLRGDLELIYEVHSEKFEEVFSNAID